MTTRSAPRIASVTCRRQATPAGMLAVSFHTAMPWRSIQSMSGSAAADCRREYDTNTYPMNPLLSLSYSPMPPSPVVAVAAGAAAHAVRSWRRANEPPNAVML